MEKIKVGKIVNTRGLKGEVKVYPYTNSRERFEEYGFLYIENERFDIEQVKYHKDMVMLKFKTLDSINDVEKYKNKNLYIKRDDIGEMEDDEHLIIDLIGLDVINMSNEVIGKIKDVLTYTAQDIYVVKTDGEDKLIPAVKAFVKKISVENGYVQVDLIEGL